MTEMGKQRNLFTHSVLRLSFLMLLSNVIRQMILHCWIKFVFWTLLSGNTFIRISINSQLKFLKRNKDDDNNNNNKINRVTFNVGVKANIRTKRENVFRCHGIYSPYYRLSHDESHILKLYLSWRLNLRAQFLPLKVDFPALTRFWIRTLSHVNFNHVNKIEAR